MSEAERHPTRTFRDYIEHRGFRGVRVEIIPGAVPVVVSRGRQMIRDQEEQDYRTALWSWIVFEPEDLGRWRFDVYEGSERRAATWADLEAWNRDVREFGGKQIEMPGVGS